MRQLWRLAYPTREIPPLKSELWKEMGWQGTDPSTDFRFPICSLIIRVPEYARPSNTDYIHAGVVDSYRWRTLSFLQGTTL